MLLNIFSVSISSILKITRWKITLNPGSQQKGQGPHHHCNLRQLLSKELHCFQKLLPLNGPFLGNLTIEGQGLIQGPALNLSFDYVEQNKRTECALFKTEPIFTTKGFQMEVSLAILTYQTLDWLDQLTCQNLLSSQSFDFLHPHHSPIRRNFLVSWAILFFFFFKVGGSKHALRLVTGTV